MKTKPVIFFILISLFLLPSCHENEPVAEPEAGLKEHFKSPPIDARPRGLWTWVNGNYDSTEIWREIEAANQQGMGGFDIWDAPTVQDPTGVVPIGPDVVSDEFMQGVSIAMDAARENDMQLGFIWNQSVSYLDPEHSHMALYMTSLDITTAGQQTFTLPFPHIKPHKKFGYKTLEQDETGRPVHWDNVAILAFPIINGDTSTIAPQKMVDLTGNVNGDELTWEVPEGNWRILRFVWSRTTENGLTPTPATLKPALDFLNPDATEEHLTYLLDLMVEHTGSLENSPMKYFCADSYEFKGLWTPALPQIFKENLGYDLTRYLPALKGYTVHNQDTTDRFLFDFNNLLGDLVIENHYAKAKEVCHRYGIGFTAEAAGPGPPVHMDVPMESIKSSGVLSFPRGEFWVSDNGKPREHLQIIKGIASAAHLYNQPYVTAEAFTGVHLWSFGPGDLKPYADRAFAEGLNRIDFHTFPHTPPEAGLPGWIYSFGNIISENLIWWPYAEGFMNYLGRTSYMLQQGRFVADVLFYHGEEAPFFAKPKHIKPELSVGYDYDIANADILLNHLSVSDGKLMVPHGQQYEILVLPDKRWMTLPVLEKIKELLENGATVIGPKPLRSNGLGTAEDQKIKRLAGELWGTSDSMAIVEKNIGKGLLVWGKTPKDVLEEKGIQPDVIFRLSDADDTLDFIHRKTDTADIYFIRNPYQKEIAAVVDFRVKGKQPERWDPVTGDMVPLSVYKSDMASTKIPLSLPPNGSVFIVFHTPQQRNMVVEKDGTTIFPTGPVPAKWPFYDIGDGNIALKQPGTYGIFQARQDNMELIHGSTRTLDLSKPWQVSFTDPWGEQFIKEIPQLKSWTEFDDHRIKFFSGTATYRSQFNLPEEGYKSLKQVILNLGKVEEVAKVIINDNPAAITWKNPATVDISSLVKKGSNTIVIEVANRWPNRMIGDYKLPDDQRKVKSNIVTLPTAWHAPLETLPNEHYHLQESGLLGPVQIRIFDVLLMQP